MPFRKFLISVIQILALYLSAHAEWTEPVRITYDFGLLDPRGVAVNETLHVVASGPTDIFYLKSADNGLSWSIPVCPADSFYGSRMPDIIYSNGLLHLAFVGYYIDRAHEIIHMSSSDGGETWSEPHTVYNLGSPLLKYPRMTAIGDTIVLSCRTERQVLVYRSLNSGDNWSLSSEVENGSILIDFQPYLFNSNWRLHLVYQMGITVPPGDSIGLEIYHRFSDDYGLTWSARTVLSTPEPYPYSKAGQAPSACADEFGDIMAIWFDYKYGSQCGFDGDILGRVSVDNGNTWLPETRLTNTETGSISSCVIFNNDIYAVWEDDYYYGCGHTKITFSTSGDWGFHWTAPQIISGYVDRIESFPVLFTGTQNENSIIHCVMSYMVSGSDDLFYFRNCEYTSANDGEDNVKGINLELSAYPNPFNSRTMISFTGKVDEIKIFNLGGRLIKRIPIAESQTQVIWDARDDSGLPVASGIYFARACGGDNSTVLKLILLK